MTEKIRDDLSRLSLEEKCLLLGQKDGSFGRAESLGRAGNVPQDNSRGGADYFRSGYEADDGQYHPVAFPPNSCLAMSWDTALAEEAGRMMAREGLANPDKITWIFRPGVNIKRSPLCGRNFEYFSEDPVAAGEMAGSYIIGMQNEGVAATLKHYICNNQEFERMTTNSVVDDRALHEIYLKAFEVAIKKGNPWSVMSSYNQVNGEWVNSNPQVMDMLRKELGYDGVVVSDFAAIHENKVMAHKCGVDIELAPDTIHVQALIDAVRRGEITEEQIDEELGRVFALCDRLENVPALTLDMDKLHEKAREAAEQCIVLLKNDGTLPVNADTDRKLLVIGNLAVNPSYYGGGSGHMNGYRIDRPLDEIRKIAGDEVDFAKGYETKGGFPPVDVPDQALITEAVRKASSSDIVFFFAGLEYCYESEGYDRADTQLPLSQRMILEQILEMNCKVVIIASCGSVLDLTPYHNRAAGVIYSGLAGESFGGAISRILFGLAEPGGRLSETFPLRPEDSPAYLNFTPESGDLADVVYGEGIFVGYRWYDARKMEVMYPFGYGLSYTSFALSDLTVSRKIFTPADTLTVCVTVKNTGSRAGSQVVQIYVKDTESTAAQKPEKELKAFAKVWLKPGEEKTISLELKKDAFSYYSPSLKKWIAEDGTFEIMAGTSCRDIILTETIELTGGDKAFAYDEMTPLVWYVRSEKFMDIIRTQLPDKLPLFQQDTFEWLCLLLPLPFYKMSQPLLGSPVLSEEEVQYLIGKMNE